MSSAFLPTWTEVPISGDHALHGRLSLPLIGNCFTRPPRLLTTSKIRDEEPVVKTDKSIGGIEYSDAYLPENDALCVPIYP